MKKQIQIAIVFLLGNILLHTQNALSQGVNWRLLGNVSTDPAINFVGTTDDVGLSFRTGTGSIRRMFIADGSPVSSTNGYVGIGNQVGFGAGTWQPTQRLHLHDQGSPAVGGVFAKWTNKN